MYQNILITFCDPGV